MSEALSAPVAASTWEVLRRLGRPGTVDEVATVLLAEPAVVRAALDGLAGIGAVEKLPIREHRRQPAYRPCAEALVVEFGPGDDADVAAMARIKEALRMQVESAARNCRNRVGAGEVGAWRSVRLDPEERDELHRLLREVLDFVEATQSRLVKAEGAAAKEVNLHLMIEACTCDADALPVPAVHFVPRGKAETFNHTSPAATMRRLSPREREIALLLVNGMSRPEIARKLGVSGNTVGTIAKRIYAKLGVRRRVELSNRIRRGAT